ncbi:MAG: JAB domain-containing protein, partial [Ruminococcus sp.]|nr:JAB domain-containing protein [Ruminococcus sp.]
ITHIKLMPDMARLYMIDNSNNPSKIIDMGNLCKYFQPLFFGKTEEVMRLLLLDNKCKIIYSGVISKGSINSTDVSIRKICELALYYNAKYAAIAHNHPSGLAKPSQNDIDCTNKVFIALQLIGVRLLDHIIVADDDSVSMAFSSYGVFGKNVKDIYKKLL